MTPAQLRAALASLLSDLLGKFTTPGGTELAAIRVGEPPSDYTVTGLEARISGVPDFDATALQGNESNLAETHLVRLVAHETADKMTAAVRRIVRTYSDASVTTVPANERLGIPAQVTIRIPR